jgi:protein-serine/threonine kinase
MATVSAPRDTPRADHSSTNNTSRNASRTSSIGSSDQPHQNGLAVPSELNGHAAPLAEPQMPEKALTAAEKPSMTKRLTRMFSTKDASRSLDSINGSTTPSTAPGSPKNEATSGTSTPQRPAPLRKDSHNERKQSYSDKPAVVASSKDKKKEKDATAHASQRYVVNPEVQGGHEHHLKSAKRQEKLTDLFMDVLTGRKRGEHHEGEQLSLRSSWVDQVKKSEKDMAGEKKGGPNATATLVEKYGKCHEVVGRGAFGIVRISHKRTEGQGEQLYAVKEFRRRPDENERKYSKRLTSEFCISSSLRHPNVIHTLDLLQDSKGDYCEVMEFCAGGDLYTLVLAAGKLEMHEADCYFKQIMRGVEYMHEMGVAHRDLKPENLLLTTHGAVKITDFGNGECFRMAWESDAHMVTGLCGSAPYIAPEEYIDKEFDARAVDVWATGVIYMAMRTGRHLWRVAKRDEDEFYERYLQGRKDEEGYAPIESLRRVSFEYSSKVRFVLTALGSLS